MEKNKYKKALDDILTVIKPMVRDWKVCPSCNGTWCEHEQDCQLKYVVEKALEVTND